MLPKIQPRKIKPTANIKIKNLKPNDTNVATAKSNTPKPRRLKDGRLSKNPFTNSNTFSIIFFPYSDKTVTVPSVMGCLLSKIALEPYV